MGRKTLLMLLALAVLVTLIGCLRGGESSADDETKSGAEQSSVLASEAPEDEPAEPQLLTADQVVQAFKDAGLPVSMVVIYTAETDPNMLLGRPGQYTGKANWADTRIEQSDPANPVGGTVEVFANEQDLATRRDYIKWVTEGFPMLQQYMYEAGNALVRLEYDLTPEQAAEYEKALLALVE